MTTIPEGIFIHLQRTERQVRRYLSLLDGIPEDQIALPRTLGGRLLLHNLVVWALRYRVEITTILDLLLRDKYHSVRKKGGLGVTPATLCGETSRKYLEERLLIAVEETQMLPVRNFRYEYEDLDDMLSLYSKTMLNRYRDRLDRQEKTQLAVRAWRGK